MASQITIYAITNNDGTITLRHALPVGAPVNSSRAREISITTENFRGIPSAAFSSISDAAEALRKMGYGVSVPEA